MWILVGLLLVPVLSGVFLLAREDVDPLLSGVIVATVLVVLVPCVWFLARGGRVAFWGAVLLWVLGTPLWVETARMLPVLL